MIRLISNGLQKHVIGRLANSSKDLTNADCITLKKARVT